MKQDKPKHASTDDLATMILDCAHYARGREPDDIDARARCFVAFLSGAADKRWPGVARQTAGLLNIPSAESNALVRAYCEAANGMTEMMLAVAALRDALRSQPKAAADEHFVIVPARTLPGGQVVPAFQYAKYPCSKGAGGAIVLSPSKKPWTNITHAEAMAACQQAGYQLARESQELAIRLDVCEQDINWTGGKVGQGKVYQGLHLGTVNGAQAADYISSNSLERSWHQLSTGERVYGLAGNIYTHVFDDIQGDGTGLIARAFEARSPSLTAAPHPSREKGMGWRPNAGADWSGRALLRGGCWNDGDNAGVFSLLGGGPGGRNVIVGFRCTKPSSGL